MKAVTLVYGNGSFRKEEYKAKDVNRRNRSPWQRPKLIAGFWAGKQSSCLNLHGPKLIQGKQTHGP